MTTANPQRFPREARSISQVPQQPRRERRRPFAVAVAARHDRGSLRPDKWLVVVEERQVAAFEDGCSAEIRPARHNLGGAPLIVATPPRGDGRVNPGK
jgi:hypothetical protein